jgi:CheY-like chemotaxis protein
MSVPLYPIILLEDDPVVSSVVRHVLAARGLANPIERFADGDAAHERLRAAAAGEAREPVLVLLDLHVPGRSGLEVLSYMRSEPALAETPVVILSGSGDDSEIERAYGLGVSAYLVKPAGIDGLQDVLSEIGLRYALLPSAQPAE